MAQPQASASSVDELDVIAKELWQFEVYFRYKIPRSS
ncbi:hypothetical protein ACVJBD_000837 [Rhizobium mongolense]